MANRFLSQRSVPSVTKSHRGWPIHVGGDPNLLISGAKLKVGIRVRNDALDIAFPEADRNLRGVSVPFPFYDLSLTAFFSGASMPWSHTPS